MGMGHFDWRWLLVVCVSAMALSPASAQQMGSDQSESAQADEEATDAEAGESTSEEPIEEVTVLGKNIPEPMIRTAEVASFITPEDLERQGDDSAAIALTRVTGLSVVQGKFVYVRGLGERYSAALLNGSALPSPEPLQRVVPLDLFPSSVLQSVVVQKTYSAKYPGEFGGGLIDLETIAVPDEPFLSMSLGTGGNTETTFSNGITYYGGDFDWLGIDDDTRDMPAALSEAIATGVRVDTGAFSPTELQRIGRSLQNAPVNLLQRRTEIQPNYKIELTGGRGFDLDWGRIGLIGVAGFDNSWQTRVGSQQEGIVEGGAIAPRTDYTFQSTQNDVLWNGLFGLSAEWGDGQSIEWTNLYIRNVTKEARSRAGNDELAGATVRDDYSEWFERELFDTQLRGRHEFGPIGLEWRGSFATTSRDAPYEKGIRYRLVNGEYLHNASQEQNYTRFSTVEDDVVNVGADFSYTFERDGRKDTIVSAGVAWLDNDRSSEAREFRLLALDGALPLNTQRQRVDFLLSDFNIQPGLLSIRETTGSEGAAAYDAALEVRAAYAQLDIEPIERVRATVGVRYEDAEQTVTPRSLFVGVTPTGAPPLENDYLLPAATVTWNFRENMQLRVGASRTIGRPQFRELAPQQYLDPDSDRLFIGNPFLTDTELLNVDSRFEWYFEEGEYLTGGVFLKQLDRPIEAIVNEAGATVQQTYVNAPEATLFGAEVEIKKYFAAPFSPQWWQDKRLFVNANYTFTDSELKVDADDIVFPLSGSGAARSAADLLRDGSQLQGQSEHLANLQFGIESTDETLQATLLGTYVSERISARGRPGQPDLLQEPGLFVDFVLRAKFDLFGQNFSAGFEARNLFGEDYEEYQELGGGRVDINRYDLGRSFSISLKTDFWAP
jgi:outer membrane receptor protein involved in Fe transport